MRHLILRIVRSHDAEATPHFPDYRSNRKVQKLWKPQQNWRFSTERAPASQGGAYLFAD